MLYRVANLIHKELLQVSRDWLLVTVLILGPALQLSLLAWNTGRGVANLPLAVVDLDHSADSRALTVALDNTRELKLQHYAADLSELRRLLDSGQAEVGVAIPVGFAADLKSGLRAPRIQIVASGANNIAGSIGLAAAQTAVAEHLAGRLSALGAPAAAIDLRADVRYNPSLDSRHFTIPAMIGLIVFELTLAVAALGLTRERETGTLEQLIIMPFRRIEIIIGKAIPPLLITLADFAMMVLIAIRLFDTPLKGSFALLLALTALFMSAEIGWGLMLSTLARTQQQAVLFVFVQAIFDMAFSGFLVPVENLPWLLAAVSAVIPLRHYLVVIRSIMLKGATLAVLWPQVLALAALALVIGLVAMLNIGRRID